MLSQITASNHSQLKKNKHNTGMMPSYRGDLDSDVCTSFFSLAVILPGSSDFTQNFYHICVLLDVKILAVSLFYVINLLYPFW